MDDLSVTGRKWIIGTGVKGKGIVDSLLEGRGIKTKKQREEFVNPKDPTKITLSEVGIKTTEVKKAIKRIKQAKTKKETVVVYGDYDADGISATAILWECIYSLGIDAIPYIPDRFTDGYGLKAEPIKELKKKNKKIKLVVTVDNGIVANEAVDAIKKQGIDVIVTDHHETSKKLPKAHSIIHTTEIGGAGVAWMFAREIWKGLGRGNKWNSKDSLDLAAIGTVSDQIPLLGPNRSIVKYGLEALNTTERPGLLALYSESRIELGGVETYHINFVIAPRINAMGRLKNGLDSLRLLCTRDSARADSLAKLLSQTNQERQMVVENVVVQVGKAAKDSEWSGAIVISHRDYHEGVIGLAAGKLVERYNRPAVVISVGDKVSKASARSLQGFNLIEALRELDDIYDDIGGHPMAAGFSIKTEKIDEFVKRFGELSAELLDEEMLTKKLKIDLELTFDQLSWDLIEDLKKFDPTGSGNPRPVFVSIGVKILESRTVGMEGKHLKLKLEQAGKTIDAIAFGYGYLDQQVGDNPTIDVAYIFEENEWNGQKSMQLRVRDLRIQNLGS